MGDFVSYELAVKLKEKGFDNECFAYYTNDATLYHNYPYEVAVYYKGCYLSHNLMTKDSVDSKFIDAPTISQVLKWLRDEKEIMVFSAYSTNTSKWHCVVVNADSLEQYNLSLSDSYEQAALSLGKTSFVDLVEDVLFNLAYEKLGLKPIGKCTIQELQEELSKRLGKYETTHRRNSDNEA